MDDISKSAHERRIRVLLTKNVLDAHDRGMKYIAKKLVEAGMEVVLASFGVAEDIVNTAIQEDVDVIGMSISTGGYMVIISDLMESLKARGMDDKLVIVGGVIPTEDLPALQEIGVGSVFGPGTLSDEVINYILKNIN
jgi:methylmalonyl-CoA mutase C-terminal domain/subunit